MGITGRLVGLSVCGVGLRGRLSCCRRSGKQDREGPRNKKLLKTALTRPKLLP
jgi:hypothetical protein